MNELKFTTNSNTNVYTDYVDDYEEALRDLENIKADGERDIENSEANVESKELSLDQTKRDYQALVEAVKSGRVTAETGI